MAAMPSWRSLAPNSIEATTLPPGELISMTDLRFCARAASRAKLMNWSGVSGSITPSATTTLGQLYAAFAALQRLDMEVHRLRARPSEIGETEAEDRGKSPAGNLRARDIHETHRRILVVGGDGLEPPTLSV